jgi:membrane protein YqaA with SNARE-associated domain
MFHDLYNWMLSWADSPYGVHALFLLAVAESSFFPIPVDVLLIAMGLAAPDQALWFALVCTVGSVLGGGVGYGIGRVGGKPILQRFVSPKTLDRIHDYFQRYEDWAIGIAGFTPVPYKVFTIAAGAFWVNFTRFIGISVLSRGARFFLVGGMIYLFGDAIGKLIERYFNLFSVAFVILLAGGFYWIHAHGKKIVNDDTNEGANDAPEKENG